MALDRPVATWRRTEDAKIWGREPDEIRTSPISHNATESAV